MSTHTQALGFKISEPLKSFDRYASTRNICGLLFVLCLLSIAWFNNGASWNQNARLDPIFSFVEPGTPDYHSFRINHFILYDGKHYPSENTGDWAWYQGNFYSNKAPGTILLGTAFYLVLFNAETLVHVPVHDPKVEIINAWLINLVVSGIPVALATVLFYLLLTASGLSRTVSMLIGLATFYGTALFPYSTQMWGHTTAAAFIVFALYCYLTPVRHSLLWAGLFAGFAVCMDYQAFIFTGCLAVLVLLRERKKFIYYIAGGMLPLVIFATYHYSCFHNPLSFASSYSNPAFIDTHQLFGLFGSVSLNVVWKLLFSVQRGIFLQMPVLCFAFLGFYFGFKTNPKDRLLWLILITCMAYVLMIASFSGWHGGATAVSRYLIPLFPLLMLTLKTIPWNRWYVGSFTLVAFISALNMMALSVVSPLVEDGNSNPILTSYSRWFSGNVEPFLLTIRLHKFSHDLANFRDFVTWNLGEFMGFKGAWGVVPLLLVQGFFIALLFILLRRQTDKLQETVA